jgi:hypothetical protein
MDLGCLGLAVLFAERQHFAGDDQAVKGAVQGTRYLQYRGDGEILRLLQYLRVHVMFEAALIDKQHVMREFMHQEFRGIGQRPLPARRAPDGAGRGRHRTSAGVAGAVKEKRMNDQVEHAP